MLPKRKTASPSTKDNTTVDALTVCHQPRENAWGLVWRGLSALQRNPRRGSWQGEKAPQGHRVQRSPGYDCASVGNESGRVRVDLGIQPMGRARQLAPSVYLEVGRKAGSF